METVLMAKDGRPIDVEIHATALFDEERGGLVIPVRLYATSRSVITWSRNCSITPPAWSRRFPSARRSWSHSQARYKALFDLVADSVFMVNAAGTVVAVNKREEQALGYAESKVVGRSMHDVVAPTHRDGSLPAGWPKSAPVNGRSRHRKSRSSTPRGSKRPSRWT